MWEGQALPHDTKFGNCRYEIVGTIVIFIWSLIHGLYWSGLIKAEPGIRIENLPDALIHTVTFVDPPNAFLPSNATGLFIGTPLVA